MSTYIYTYRFFFVVVDFFLLFLFPLSDHHISDKQLWIYKEGNKEIDRGSDN